MSKTLRRTTLALAAFATLIAFTAPSALAAPTASFSVTPMEPRCRVPATYTSTSTPDEPLFAIAKVEWDFDNNGSYEEVNAAAPFEKTHTFNTRGPKVVGIKATDSNPLAPEFGEADQTVTVVTGTPQAKFKPSDTSPLVGSEVLFASEPTDPDGDPITSYAWDFDGNGSTDATLPNPVHTFTSPGTNNVTLRVTDSCGATSAPAQVNVVVQGPPVPGNSIPVANFAFSPRTARVGDQVAFVSSALDPEGDLRDQAWDLDGDGEFDDGKGAEVVYTYTTPGTKLVRLRATDGTGASAVQERRLTVTPVPPPPPGYMRPWPSIRFNGQLLSRGTRVQILSVRAPKGALVRVTCRKKGCPAPQRRKRIKNGPTRFRTYERFLRAGVQLSVFIREEGKIGRYKRFTIRAGKGPRVLERCLAPGKKRPIRCR